MPEVIKLPSERVAQLRSLSDALNRPISDLIGDFVREQIAKGNLADEVPGFRIQRENDAVIFGVDGDPTVRLGMDAAREFAVGIDQAVAGRNAGMINADADWLVARAGSGIRIGTLTGGVKVVARDVARDVARLINREAAAA